MSAKQKARSTLSIGAVAQAAANGAAGATYPGAKLNAIAGLAGFVLRLFLFKEQLPAGPAWSAVERLSQPPGSFREGYEKAARRIRGGSARVPFTLIGGESAVE